MAPIGGRRRMIKLRALFITCAVVAACAGTFVFPSNAVSARDGLNGQTSPATGDGSSVKMVPGNNVDPDEESTLIYHYVPSKPGVPGHWELDQPSGNNA